MAQAYLVGHGGALSPNTPGGDPVGNALRWKTELDRTAIQKQQSESYARQLDLTERAQNFKQMRAQLDLVGSNSPQGQAIARQLAGDLGLPVDENTDPELLSTVIGNGFKKVDGLVANRKLSPQAISEGIGEMYFAAVDALKGVGGTKQEKEAAFRALGDVYRTRLGEGRDASRQARQYGYSSALQGQRSADSRALVDYKLERGVGRGSTGTDSGPRTRANSEWNRALEEQPWLNGIPVNERTPERVEFEMNRYRDKVLTRNGLAPVTPWTPDARDMGPTASPNVPTGRPAPAEASPAQPAAGGMMGPPEPPRVSTGDPSLDSAYKALGKSFAKIRAMQGTGRDRLMAIVKRAKDAGLQIEYSPEAGLYGQDYEKFGTLFESTFTDDEAKKLFGE